MEQSASTFRCVFTPAEKSTGLKYARPLLVVMQDLRVPDEPTGLLVGQALRNHRWLRGAFESRALGRVEHRDEVAQHGADGAHEDLGSLVRDDVWTDVAWTIVRVWLWRYVVLLGYVGPLDHAAFNLGERRVVHEPRVGEVDVCGAEALGQRRREGRATNCSCKMGYSCRTQQSATALSIRCNARIAQSSTAESW